MLSFALRAGFVHRDQFFSRLSTLVAFAFLLVTTACSSSKTVADVVPSAKANVPSNTSTLRLGFISSTNKVPIGPTGWAIHQGILKPELQKAGISDVRMVGFPNGPDLNEALVAGQVDLGIYGDAPALVAKAKGIKTRLINQEQVGMNVWLLAKKNGPRSIAELKGQKVATSRGSYMHRYLLGLLQESGLTQDVTVVHLLPRDAQVALERGDVAAFAAPTGLGPLLLSKGFPLIDEAAKHPNLPGTSVTVATDAFLAQHSDFPQKWNQIAKEAVKDIKANQEEYYKFHAEATGYPLDVVKASYPLDQFPEEPLPAKGLELLEGTKKFLVSQKLAKSDFKLTDWAVTEK